MGANSDQLALLGQRVLDAVIATYNPDGDPALALALHPGQPLADAIVQDGVTNELRLSEWIGDQYDYPLWLKRSDASSVSASSVGSLTAKSAYLAMVPWAQPGVAADSPAFDRISALIAEAQRMLGGNPDALPFGCEPTDFAQTDSTAWHVFDQRISSTSTVRTVEEGSDPGVAPNAQLWKMRPVTEQVVARLPLASDAAAHEKSLVADLLVTPRAEAVKRLRAMPDVMDFVTQPVDDFPQVMVLDAVDRSTMIEAASFGTDSRSISDVSNREVLNLAVAPEPLHARLVGRFPRVRVGALAAAMAEAAPAPEPAPEPPAFPQALVKLNADAFGRLATIQLHDLRDAPVVSEVTTSSDTELHVHFEYCMLTITRRLAGSHWWNTALLNEDDWYVPGMRRGDMVKASSDPDYAHWLPQTLLLVRNVEFSGSWSTEARETIEKAATFIGPFLMQPAGVSATSASDTETVSVLGVGVQVIGELCFPLPPLPPMDDPA